MSSNDNIPLRYIVQKHKEKRDVNRGKLLFRDGMWRGHINMEEAIHRAPSLIKDQRSAIFVPLLMKGMIQAYVHHVLSRP